MAYHRVCNHPGCRKFAEENSRYCTEHQPKKEKTPFKGEWLSDRAKAFYNSSRWKKERTEFLKANPDCAICGAPATDVHHQFDDFYDFHNPTDFYDRDHWVPLCSDCHDKVSHEAMARRRRQHVERKRMARLWY